MKKQIVALLLIFATTPLLAKQETKSLKANRKSLKKSTPAEKEKSSKKSAKKVITDLPKNMLVIDKIVARVNGSNILKSSLEVPQIAKDGQKYTLDEAITEELLLQRADEKKLLPAAADIERQIVAFKMQNNLTELSDEAFEEELKGMGLALAGYKRQLGRLLAIENLKRSEFSEKLVTTAQEVENYYNENPVYSKEKFRIAIADLTPEQAKNIKKLDPTTDITWQDRGWFERDGIHERYRDIVVGLKPGKVSRHVITDDDKLQIVWLKEKREHKLKPLNKRYAKIEQELQQAKREPLMDNLIAELKTKAQIVIL